MSDVGKLTVSVEADGVDRARKSLDDLAASGAKAERAVDSLAGSGKGLSTANKEVERSQDSLAKSQAAFLAGLKEQSDLYGKSRADVLAYKAAQLGITEQAAPLIATINAQNQAVRTLGAGQKLTGNQATQLGYQLNDLFVQIASGQSPLTALIQQGSQLNGTFGGFRGTLRALGTLFTTTTVSIGAVAAVLGTVGYGFYNADKQAEEFRKTLALTGGAAGITRGQFVQMAGDIATATRTSIGSARETLQALAASGQFSGTALTSAATAVQGFAKVTGESNDKVAASFIKGASSVTTFADTLNQQYNFLSNSQRQAIKDAEEQGNAQQALTILFDALNKRIDEVGTSTNALVRGFGSLKSAAIGLKDAFLGLFEDDTPEQRLAGLEKRLADLQKPKAATGRSGVQSGSFLDIFNGPRRGAGNEVANLEAAIAAEQRLVKTEQDRAKSAAERRLSNEAAAQFARQEDQFQTNAQKREKEIDNARKQAAAANKTTKPGDDAYISDERLKQQIKNIEQRYKDPKQARGTARQDANAAAREQLEDIKSRGQAELDEYQSQDRLLEARRAALLIRDKAYYDEKLRIAQASTRAQISTLEQENQYLESRTGLNASDASNRDRQVIANKTRIASLNKQLSTTEQEIGIRSDFAQKTVARGLEDAREAAQAYLDVQQRSYDLALQGLTLSDREVSKLQAISQIREKYAQQRLSLEADRRREQISPETYDAELKLIQEFEKRAVDEYTRYFDKTVSLSQDANVGMQKALANYFDEASNTAKQSQELFANAFKGLEDALVTFATTGKLSFKSLADSVIADLVRMQARAAITSLFKDGNLLSGIAGAFNPEGGLSGIFGGGRASGGPVAANTLYRVNEQGPELLNVAGKQYLMMGGQSGSVTPNGGSSSPNVTVVNQTTGRIDSMQADYVSRGELRLILRESESRQDRKTVQSMRNPNGALNAATNASFRAQRKY